jgi:hypothetical protein
LKASTRFAPIAVETPARRIRLLWKARPQLLSRAARRAAVNRHCAAPRVA